CGGSAANTVIALSHFGGRGFFACRVADDENGRIYLEGLEEAGVQYPNHEPLPQGESGRCLVLISPDAERSMNTYLGASEAFSESNIDFGRIAESEYLYIEGYLVTSETGRPAAIKAGEFARHNGTKIALSLSDPGIVTYFKKGLEAMVGSGVDLLFCNRGEALEWTGADNLKDAADQLRSIARQFAITNGSEGSLLFDGETYYSIDAHDVTAVDTNGAGDMFAGAFLYGLSEGFSFQDCGNFASLAAAAVVSHYGPRLHPQQHRELLAEFHRQNGIS
ncbi:MAG: adenosine kinase, partial [bacterium]